MTSPKDMEDLYYTLAQLNTINYIIAVALAVTIYNILLRLSDEVELIWKARWSTAKVLYFITRYSAPVFLSYLLYVSSTINPPRKICNSFVVVISLGAPIILPTAVNIILSLRLFALYGRKWKMSILLAVLVIAELATGVYSVITTTLGQYPTDPPSGLPWPGCVYRDTVSSKHNLVSWVTVLVVSLAYFLLMAYKTISIIKMKKQDGQSHSPKPSLLTAFIRDGTLYFFLVFYTVVVMTVIDSVKTIATAMLAPFALLIAGHSFAGSGLILNLRAAAHSSNESIWHLNEAVYDNPPNIRAMYTNDRGTHVIVIAPEHVELQTLARG